MNGGEVVARTLRRHGVEFLFTLCGGHISPILVESRKVGLRIVDVRHEVDAVFAADAVARLSGVPGVAAVTAGPGVTNSVTAVKNAQLAQSPVVILGGATATVLENRGSLQDIDQLSLLRSSVKWLTSVRRLRDLGPALDEALRVCRSKVPGPVFLECPLDLLYEERIVREWYGRKSGTEGLKERLLGLYLERHLNRLFASDADEKALDGDRGEREVVPPSPVGAPARAVRRAAGWLSASHRPLLLVGSQATVEVRGVERLADAVGRLGIPTYLSGMARGLLGVGHPVQRRHGRRDALKEADLILLAGAPADFRLDYGRQFGRAARVISVNRSRRDLRLNRRPDLGVVADAGRFLVDLAEAADRSVRGGGDGAWEGWLAKTAEREAQRQNEIEHRASEESSEGVNPLRLFLTLDELLPESSVLVADGGDFVATAAYTLSPRGPLTWLDPGVFGTLGVGGGFALGAKLCRPDSEVWILYGDGSAAYSLAEFDSYVRHRLPVIALVGNDASWAQIAREQVPMLGDDVGTVLRHTAYERVAEGYGGRGLRLAEAAEIRPTLEAARALHAAGHPVLINARLARSDFRRGSLSM